MHIQCLLKKKCNVSAHIEKHHKPQWSGESTHIHWCSESVLDAYLQNSKIPNSTHNTRDRDIAVGYARKKMCNVCAKSEGPVKCAKCVMYVQNV